MTVEQVIGWFLSLFTAVVVAWLTAWLYSRRETDRLVKVWERERRKETCDSVKQDIRRFVEGVMSVPIRRAALEEKGVGKPEHIWDAFLDAQRALGCAAATSEAIGDKQLKARIADLHGPADRLGEKWEEDQVRDLVAKAGLALRRCDELLEEMGKSKSWWKRLRA